MDTDRVQSECDAQQRLWPERRLIRLWRVRSVLAVMRDRKGGEAPAVWCTGRAQHSYIQNSNEKKKKSDGDTCCLKCCEAHCDDFPRSLISCISHNALHPASRNMSELVAFQLGGFKERAINTAQQGLFSVSGYLKHKMLRHCAALRAALSPLWWICHL